MNTEENQEKEIKTTVPFHIEYLIMQINDNIGTDNNSYL